MCNLSDYEKELVNKLFLKEINRLESMSCGLTDYLDVYASVKNAMSELNTIRVKIANL